MDRVRRVAKEALSAVWQARWWLLAVLLLCLADQAVRMRAFHVGTVRSLRLWLFYSALASVPVFLLGRLARFVSPILFGYWLMVEALQFWVLRSFNMALGGNWVLMLFSTSSSEIHEFAEGFFSFWNVAYVVCVFAATAAIVWFFAARCRTWPRVSPVSVCIALACVAFSCGMAPRIFRAPVSWAQVSRDLLALNFPADTVANWNTYRNLAAACGREPPFDLSVGRGALKPEVCVFVIGESTTRNHMGIYGYHRDTTPELSALKKKGGLMVFSGLTAAHSTTPESLCTLLTDGDMGTGCRFNAIFPAMLKKAGYRTALISCQGHWQNKDVVGSHLFLSCESRIFLQGARVAGTLPDEVALPEVEKALLNRTGPLALFVHLYGCHEPTSRRVPKWFAREWPPSVPTLSAKSRRRIDSYDTAVAYDDHIVASIIKMVDRMDAPAFVFFVSDRGESPSSPIWRDAKSRDTFDIPLLVWLSPEYRSAFPQTSGRIGAARERQLRMDQLLEGMLELARVEGYRPWNSNGNFIAPGFVGARQSGAKGVADEE